MRVALILSPEYSGFIEIAAIAGIVNDFQFIRNGVKEMGSSIDSL
jgi:hypothetical protein